jgi:hypothetical protein
MEGKKNKYDAAELDLEFLDRLWQVGYEEMMSYLQTLPEAERKAMQGAIDREIGRRIVKEHIEYLQCGLEI